MEKIELTDEEASSILDKINKEKKDLLSKTMELMEKIFGKDIRYENFKRIELLEGILNNVGKPIDSSLVGSALTLVSKFFLRKEDYGVVSGNYIIAKGTFRNQGTLPWDNEVYDMFMLINLDTGYAEEKVAYTSDEDAALKELLKDYYVSEIIYNGFLEKWRERYDIRRKNRGKRI